MMENTLDDGCVPTEPISTHCMDCEDEGLEECQKIHYANRFDEYSELLNLVKSYQTLLASSSEKIQPTSTSSTSSHSTICTPGIKPVDINSLLQPPDPRPAMASFNSPQTVVVSPSPGTSTSPSGRVWLEHGAVQVVNGKPVRLQFVTSSSLVPNQIRVAAPRTGNGTVRIAIPPNTPYLPGPIVSSFVSSPYATRQIAPHMSGGEILAHTGNGQPPMTEPVANQTTIVASNQKESLPVRAVHNLPQQPNIPLRAPSSRPTMQPASSITLPWARQSYSSGRLPNPVQTLPETQSRALSNSVAVTEPNVASLNSHLKNPHMPISTPWANQSTCLPSPVPEQRQVTKPVITYGPASSPSAPLIVQLPVSQSPPIIAPPPNAPTEPNAGISLPQLPCSVLKQNQDQRHSDPMNGIVPPSDLVDLTEEEGSTLKPNNPGNAAGGKGVDNKIFPSLVVVARPSLNKFSASSINSERQAFDAEIRKMLACPVRHFIKRLFRLGLLLSSQQCSQHGNPMTFREPPLWVAKCCADKSVFANSLFEGSSLSPVGVIKLLYHWACNTNVQNVIYWVKVDNVVVRTYYTNFRAVCTTVVQEKIGLLGGNGKMVQIGVISLGTTTEENGPKEVKLDILAALDEDQKRIRLKALDNSEINKNWDEATVYKYKFRRIAENLRTWIDPDSIIILDFVVDYEIFRENGFQNVVMSGNDSNCSNTVIMTYLRKSIPQMFQSTLSLLSINIIQQFLDELVWREIWGPTPSLAYENLVVHIAEIMKLSGPPIMEKLKLIAQNPSSEWKYCTWKKKQYSKLKSSEAPAPKSTKDKSNLAPASNKRAGPRNRKIPPATSTIQPNAPNDGNEKSPAPPKPAVAVPPTSLNQLLTQNATPRSKTASNARQISLELYYYGFIKGNPVSDQKTFSILCVFCSALISSGTDLTEHLIAHALDAAFSWYMIPYMKKICWYCFAVVTDIKTHVAELHPPPRNTPTTCKICAIDFQESDALIEHMTQTHTELDMPYECQICEFRTSVLEEILIHFQFSHKNDPCAVCPYCLKAVKMISSPCLVSGQAGLQNYFVQHIQKHRIESLNKKCEKCALSFVNHDCLKKHQDTYHVSCKGKPNLTRYKILPSKVVMMNRPAEPPLPPVTSTESNFHTLQGKTLPLPQFTLDSEILSLNCLECDGPISDSHYTLKLKCTKCAFTSHCANAIREHSTRAHSTEHQVTQRTGGIPTHSSFSYCSNCDFHSNDWNRTADHLAECGSYATVALKRNQPPKVSPKRRRQT